MALYQLVQYLRTEIPAEIFYINERPPSVGGVVIPDRNVLVKETGGIPQPWTKYTEGTIQILCRDSSTPAARKLAYDIYNVIHDRFGQNLPLANIGGDIYNILQTVQITAIQIPQSIGADDEGRSRFSTNYKVIYSRHD